MGVSVVGLGILNPGCGNCCGEVGPPCFNGCLPFTDLIIVSQLPSGLTCGSGSLVGVYPVEQFTNTAPCSYILSLCTVVTPQDPIYSQYEIRLIVELLYSSPTTYTAQFRIVVNRNVRGGGTVQSFERYLKTQSECFSGLHTLQFDSESPEVGAVNPRLTGVEIRFPT